MDSARARFVRVTWEIAVITGDLTIAPAYQVSNSLMDNGGASQTIHSSTNSVNTFVGNSFKDLFTDGTVPTIGKAYVRFGWIVKNAAQTTVNWGQVRAIRIEIRDC
jgi:hypothetical protein